MKLLIADGESLAREWLKSLVVDIILLDIRMPEMDGIEAAQHLSNLENLKLWSLNF